MASEPLYPPLQPDDTVGAYTIVEQIGAGGTSVVYKANDVLINKDVAIKQITLSDADGALRDRVEVEAALQKKVAADAPDQVVHLIEVIDDPRGLMLVNEYVEGPSLEWILSQVTDPMPVKQALGILAGSAMSLRAIHEHGIIHRDLKPANILMPRKGGLKIADFGLAAVVAEQGTLSLGSVRYMAPELFGDGPVDRRADLYSLGMIAYEMLAGRTKFDEAFRVVTRDQRNGQMRWMKWHTNPRAKAPPLTQLVPDIDPSLSDLVARLMEKDPATRIVSADELLKAIRRHFAAGEKKSREDHKSHAGATGGSSASAADAPREHGTGGQAAGGIQAVGGTQAAPLPGAGGSHTAPLPPRRNGLAKFAAIAVATVILVGGGVGIWWFLNAQFRTENARQAVRERFNEAMSAYDEARYADARAAFDEVSQSALADRDTVSTSRAGVHLSRGRIAMADQKYNVAVEAFEEADRLGAKRIDATEDLIRSVRQAAAFNNAVRAISEDIAAERFAEGLDTIREWRDLVQNEDEAQTLRELAAQLGEQQVRDRVARTLARVDQLVRVGQRSQAIGELRDAVDKSPAGSAKLRDRLRELESGSAFDAAMARGAAAESTGKLDDAVQAYREAANLRKDDGLTRKLADLESSLLLRDGLRLLSDGKTAEAEDALTRSLGIKDTPDARAALSRIVSAGEQNSFVRAGDSAYKIGQYEVAVTQYKNALEHGTLPDLQQKLVEAQVMAALVRAQDALEVGDVAEAERQMVTASRLVPDDPRIAAARSQFDVRRQYLRYRDAGNTARENSKFGDAKYNYERARRIIETPEIKRLLSETEYDHLVAQARSYMAVGQYVPARALLRTAADIRVTDEVKQMLEEIRRYLPATNGD